MSDRILGRAAELEQVRCSACGRDAGGARARPDGVGKTTIWEEGVRLAGERGLRVLAARPAEGEAALPFAALGDLLGRGIDRPAAAAAHRARTGAPACRRG